MKTIQSRLTDASALRSFILAIAHESGRVRCQGVLDSGSWRKAPAQCRLTMDLCKVFSDDGMTSEIIESSAAGYHEYLHEATAFLNLT